MFKLININYLLYIYFIYLQVNKIFTEYRSHARKYFYINYYKLCKSIDTVPRKSYYLIHTLIASYQRFYISLIPFLNYIISQPFFF